MSAQGEALLRLENLSVAFAARGPDAGTSPRFRAVDDVSLGIAPGEVLGLVGESGSGKTTLAKALLRLYKPAAGRIVFRGADLAAMGERALAPFRRDLQMVFQDPLSSFNPRHTVFEALAIPLRLHRICPRGEVSQRVDAILARVGLPAGFRDRFPHELSGGQLQRVAIGRALTLSPSLLVADEAVSKLDVSIRAQILNLLKDVRDSLGVSIIFITHDLHVARYLCDRVGVMYFGKLVELGTVDQIFDAPRHPYTCALLGTLEDELRGEGGPASFAPPAATGCRYASRCPHAAEVCVAAHPPMEAVTVDHDVACHRWREIDRV
ncbi:MAG: ABC transporter ATP-binding protein [Alphaproteobacteria bacterium]|nr:ABC transporter ATP-binding protein [Alphaproteobacteria bacterium]